MSALARLTAERGRYALLGARVHRTALDPDAAARHRLDADGFAALDLVIDRGRIEDALPAGADLGDLPGTALGGRVVLPAFVDCHVHLDKGHVWPRAPNPDGTFDGALHAAGADREARWSADDVGARMRFALDSAFAHGTAAVRTHLDSPAPQERISWPVFEAVREEWAGRIELQAACLFGIDAVGDTAWFDALVRRVAAAGGVLGAVTYPIPDLDAHLDTVFAAALEHDLELDFHADETQDPESGTLDRIAAAATRHRFERPILVGHCCSLARRSGAEARRALDAVAATTIRIVSLPLCNLYLQDRRTDGTTPRRRGVTLVHEMAARGIEVSMASDNTRDPFYAYGDLDMLEVLRTAVRVAHLDHPLGDWPACVGATPARAMSIGDRAGRIAPGRAADLVVCRGRSWSEVLSRPESAREVLRAGRAIDTTPPDYARLDGLFAPARTDPSGPDTRKSRS